MDIGDGSNVFGAYFSNMTLVAVPPFSKLLRMSIADRYGFVLNQIYNPRAVVISIAKTSKEMMTRRFLRGCFFRIFLYHTVYYIRRCHEGEGARAHKSSIALLVAIVTRIV